MTASTATAVSPAIDLLAARFLLRYPRESVQLLEQGPPADAAELLSGLALADAVPVWRAMSTGIAVPAFQALSPEARAALLAHMEPDHAVRFLLQLPAQDRDGCLEDLPARLAGYVRQALSHPPDTAGHLMDPEVFTLSEQAEVAAAVALLRRRRSDKFHFVKLVDEAGRLTGMVDVRRLAYAEPGLRLGTLMQPLPAVAQTSDRREDLVRRFDQLDLTELPVIDGDGHLIGVIRHDRLVAALKDEASVDIQTMVGASKDERALSSSWFAVRKRMPWLQINLLTAFLAAAVVGMFEDTIAKITALAVLLPVVAGQSGNAGAQALAVTMRGIALREITTAQWFQVVRKEVNAGFWNGLSVALTCAIGVYVWSGSVGLVIVIVAAMLIAMVMAGIAGALVPIVLARLGQDPAVASSIILTTVTDVAGFLSFLGIATALMELLQ